MKTTKLIKIIKRVALLYEYLNCLLIIEFFTLESILRRKVNNYTLEVKMSKI